MAHLVIIELPGGNDTDIVHAALDRGDDVTFVSARLDHYRAQPQVAAVLEQVREQMEVTPFDYAELERRVLQAHSRLAIDGVLCLVDTRLIEASRLAARLGLRHLNPASAVLLRDKFNVRCRLADVGIAQPEFALATSTPELYAAVERLGVPVLIKPADGYGSQNIVALRHPEDLDPLLSPLGDMLPSRSDYGLGVMATDRLVVERMMVGTVIGCDTLTRNGQHQLLGIQEKRFFEPPSFAIRGGCFLANRPEFAAIERYLYSVLDAVGFDWGATHTELMLTTDGPRLIEVNPRLVGAKLPRLVGHALNRSLHDAVIRLHVGEEPQVSSPRPAEAGVTRWIVADRVGVLDRVDMPQRRDDRIRCVDLIKQPGDFVRPPVENADRIGYVIACAPTPDEATAVADEFVRGCQVATRVAA